MTTVVYKRIVDSMVDKEKVINYKQSHPTATYREMGAIFSCHHSYIAKVWNRYLSEQARMALSSRPKNHIKDALRRLFRRGSPVGYSEL